MSLSGSGVGGNIGGPQQQMPMQQEMSATDQTPRMNLGITKNTDDILFSTFGKTTLGPDKKDNYKSDSSNPNLERPLNMFRVGTGIVDQPMISWEGNYNQLLNLLPDDDREALQRNQQLPPEQQDPYMVAMDEVLQSTAMFLSYFSSSLDIVGTESALNGSIYNGSAPLTATGVVSQEAGGIAAGNNEYLEDVGPNEPFFDNMSLVGRTGNSFFTQLETVVVQIMQNGLTPDLKTQLANIANGITAFLPQAQTLLNEGDLLAFQVMLSTVSLLAGAASLQDASSALLIGTSGALAGTQGSPISILGENVTNGLLNLAMPDADSATRQLLTGIATLGLIVAIGIAQSFGNTKDPTAIDTFKQELGLILVTASEVLPLIYTDLASALGANAKGQAIIGLGLTIADLLMASYVLSGNNLNIPEGISPTLGNYFVEMADNVDEAIQEGTLSPNYASLAASLEQGSIALQNGDTKTFQTVLQNSLNDIGLNWPDIEAELENVNAQTTTTNKALDLSLHRLPTATITG